MSEKITRPAVRDEATGSVFWLTGTGDLVCAPLAARRLVEAGAPEFREEEACDADFASVEPDVAARDALIHVLLAEHAGMPHVAAAASAGADRYHEIARSSDPARLAFADGDPTMPSEIGVVELHDPGIA